MLDSSVSGSNWEGMASAADTVLFSGRLASQGADSYFRDLGPLMEADAAFDTEDFWPGMLASCQTGDGRILGVPTVARMMGIFYNETAFDQAGLSLPAPGWTWDDFRQITTQLTLPQGEATRYGFADATWLSSSLLAAQVAENLAENGDRIVPEGMAADLQWYVDASKAGLIYPLSPLQDFDETFTQKEALFQENPPAMWAGELSSSMPGKTSGEAGESAYDWLALAHAGFAPYPVASDNPQDQTTPMWSACAAMSNGTRHPQAAWTWLAFLSRHWVPQNWAGAFGEIPSRPSVAEESGYWEALPEKAEPAVRFILEHAWYGYPRLSTYQAVENALAKTLTEGVDLISTLNEAQVILSDESDTLSQGNIAVIVATPIPPEALVDQIEIKYAVLNTGSAEMFEFSGAEGSVLQRFSELHPEVVVTNGFDYDPSLGQDWYAALAESVDCFTAFTPVFLDAPTTTQFLNLTPLIAQEGKEWVEDYYPELLEAYRYEGELYGLPAATQPEVVYYNADLLAQRGLQMPPLDWTFDDFIQLASAASAEDIYGYFSPTGDPFFFNGRGTPGYDLNTLLPVIEFNTPEMVSTLNWMVDLYQAGILLPYGETPWESNDQQLIAGKVAFWTSPAGWPDRYSREALFGTPLNYKVGVVPLPRFPGTSVVGYSGLNRGHFISRHSEHPEACWAWIKFLSEQPAAFTGVPPRRSVAESPAWEAFVGQQQATVYRAALENLAQAGSTSDLGWWLLDVWRGQALSAALQGANPERLLAETQHKAETFVACMTDVNPDLMTRQEVQERTNSCARLADPQGDW